MPNKDYVDLYMAVKEIGSEIKTTLTIAKQLPVAVSGVSEPVIVTGNIVLKFTDGGSISIKSGDKVTIKGTIEAGQETQIFFQDPNGIVEFDSSPIQVYPQWWGAKGDGIIDDLQAFQQAIDSLVNGGTVLVPPKVYKLGKKPNPISPSDPTAYLGDSDTTSLLIDQSNITFKGDGGVATLVAKKDSLQRVLSVGKKFAQDLTMRIPTLDFRNWRQLKGYQIECFPPFIQGDNKVTLDRRYFTTSDTDPTFWAFKPEDKVLLLCQEGGSFAPNFMEFKEIKSIAKGTPTIIEFTEPIRLKPEWSNIWHITNLTRGMLVRSTFDPKLTNKSTIRVSMNEGVIADQFKGCKLRQYNHAAKEKPEEQTILHNTIVENCWMYVTVEKEFSFVNARPLGYDVEIIDENILVEKITIENITIRGNSPNDTRQCLYANWVKNLCLKNVKIEIGWIGCQLDGIWGGVISGEPSDKCTISSCGHGFNLSGCTDLKISDYDIKKCTGIGIFNDDPSGFLDIYNNTIEDCTNGGIVLNRVFHGRISGNCLKQNGLGNQKANLTLNSAIYTLVSDNKLVAPTGAINDELFVNMLVFYSSDYPMIYKNAYLRFVKNKTSGAGELHGARFNAMLNKAVVQPYTAVHNILLGNNQFEEGIDWGSYEKVVINEGKEFKAESKAPIPL